MFGKKFFCMVSAMVILFVVVFCLTSFAEALEIVPTEGSATHLDGDEKEQDKLTSGEDSLNADQNKDTALDRMVTVYVSEFEYDESKEDWGNEYTLEQRDAEVVMEVLDGAQMQLLDSPLLSVATLRIQFGENYLETSMDSLDTLSGILNGKLVVIKLEQDEYNALYEVVFRYIQMKNE